MPGRYVTKLYGGIVLACQSVIYAEFPSARAYLVGSALTATTRPRDVDVRIVLSDEAFCAKFGFADASEPWRVPGNITWPRSQEWWAYERFRDDVETFVANACGEKTMDVSIVPERIWTIHAGDPREVLIGPREVAL
jgi:hypothetical protein